MYGLEFIAVYTCIQIITLFAGECCEKSINTYQCGVIDRYKYHSHKNLSTHVGDNCIICTNTMENINNMWACERCNLITHLKCWEKWEKYKPTCPTCRYLYKYK